MSNFARDIEDAIMLDDIEENLGIKAVEFLGEKIVGGETWLDTRIQHPHGTYRAWTTIVDGELIFGEEEDLSD